LGGQPPKGQQHCWNKKVGNIHAFLRLLVQECYPYRWADSACKIVA
jgi:hypothetical protein